MTSGLQLSSVGPVRSRRYWADRIETLDPRRDYHEISQILTLHEFPWDITQALSFALFRTYAVPSIGRLLAETGEFTRRTQKRYDDTSLLLGQIIEHGLDDGRGRAAVRRINQMHAMYDISNDDMRYVLSTFVVIPIRWLDDFGWRPLTERERVASTTYYLELARHMGIRGLPATWQEFEILLDDYEAQHFAYDEQARAVADATLDLMTTFEPNDKAPASVVKRFSYALMDEPLLDAFRYPHPSAAERALARGALKARGRALRLARPRMTPKRVQDFPWIRSYPHGFDVAQLGTFPADPL